MVQYTMRKMENPSTPELNMRLMVLGDRRVGKTSLLAAYLTNAVYSEHTDRTVDLQIYFESSVLDDTKINLHIYDTPAYEPISIPVILPFCRRDVAYMIIFDVCNLQSFHTIHDILEDLRSKTEEEYQHLSIVLIGNKSDVVDHRQVTIKMGKNMAMQYGLPYIETSVKHKENLMQAFVYLQGLWVRKSRKYIT